MLASGAADPMSREDLRRGYFTGALLEQMPRDTRGASSERRPARSLWRAGAEHFRRVAGRSRRWSRCPAPEMELRLPACEREDPARRGRACGPGATRSGRGQSSVPRRSFLESVPALSSRPRAAPRACAAGFGRAPFLRAHQRGDDEARPAWLPRPRGCAPDRASGSKSTISSLLDVSFDASFLSSHARSASENAADVAGVQRSCTLLATLLTFWPPGPPERTNNTRSSLPGIAMRSVMRMSAMTHSGRARREWVFSHRGVLGFADRAGRQSQRLDHGVGALEAWNRRPLSSRNSTATVSAMRLLPSTKGWFFARPKA